MRNGIKALAALLLVALPREALADAVDDLAPGQWYRIPDTRIRDVCPQNTPSYDWGFYCKGVTTAWSGATLDTTRGRLLVWGGGHGDYKGNEIYAFDLGKLSWERSWGPTPDAQIPSGATHEVYDDGNPGSRHTYSGLTYVPPPVDAMFSMGGALWQTGFPASGTWSFSLQSSTWSRKVDGPKSQGYGDPSVYDPVTKHIFRRANARMIEYSPESDQYSDRAGVEGGFWASDVATALDPEARLMVIVGGGRLDLYHLDTDTYEPDITLSGASVKDVFGGGCPGIDFDPTQKKFVLWSGGLDVYSFNTTSHSLEKYQAAGDDPGPSTMSGGVFGRFRYVPSRNVFVRVNGVDDDVFVFRMSSGTGTPIPPGGSGGSGGSGSAGSGGSGGSPGGDGGTGQAGGAVGGAAGSSGGSGGGAGSTPGGAGGSVSGGAGGVGAAPGCVATAQGDEDDAGCSCGVIGGEAAGRGGLGALLGLALLAARRRGQRWRLTPAEA